jgi:CO/xanthine dehydrogenase FAD-binding subunit
MRIEALLRKPRNLAILAVLCFAVKVIAAPAAQHDTTISTSTRSNPADFAAIKAVCTQCHAAALFMDNPRPWNRWNEVFIRMTQRGAHPNEEQVGHIVHFFLENLTLVNVNSSPADELGPALGVSDAVAGQIVQRRGQRKFQNIADLLSLPGVDGTLIEQRKARIQF